MSGLQGRSALWRPAVGRLAPALRPGVVSPSLLFAVDGLVATALGLAMIPGIEQAGSKVQVSVAVLSVLALALAVAGRRRWPVAGAWAGAAAVSVDAAVARVSLVNQDTLPVMIAAVLLFYASGAFARAPGDLAGLVGGVALLLPQIFITPSTFSDLFFEPVLLGLAPWSSGRALRGLADRERAERSYAALVRAEIDERARLAAHRESSQMARELHDSLGHRLSVINLQASGARLMLRSDPARSAAALDVIEQGCREAVSELRELATASGFAGPDHGGVPQPGVEDIGSLTGQVSAPDLVAVCCVEGIPQPVPPGLGLSAYRIVQESLTNTIKHSRATEVVVRVIWHPGELVVRVDDNGPGRRRVHAMAGHAHGHGHGIIGMHERAALHNGSLDAAATRHGFRVQARLPLPGNIS